MSTPTTSTLSASASATTEIFDLNAVGLDNMLSSWYQFVNSFRGPPLILLDSPGNVGRKWDRSYCVYRLVIDPNYFKKPRMK